jgi:hypothetical protein
MEERTCVDGHVESGPVVAPEVALTPTDRERLTFFKWRYVLQADGFAVAQARRLTFMRWLYLQGRLVE